MAATVLYIGGTSYTSTQRAAMGFAGLDALTSTVDEYSELAFTVWGCGPLPPFLSGQNVLLTIDQGSGPVTKFSGSISSVSVGRPSDGAWSYSYRCQDLNFSGDNISIQNSWGGAVCAFNLPSDDLDFDPTLVGQTVGQIVAYVLQVYNTAQALYGLGVGGYTFASGPPPTATLAAQTLIDLSFLTTPVPRTERLEGNAILSVMLQFVQRYYQNYCMYVNPLGVIRFVNPFGGFATYNLKVPGLGQTAPDPVEPPIYNINTAGCFTQTQIIGQDLDSAYLTTSNGDLTPFNNGTDRSNWNVRYHFLPFSTTAYGNVTITSSTTATVTCDDPTIFWASGFWPGIGGVVNLINTGVDGTHVQVSRLLTTCSALSAGGSGTIAWDSSQPLPFSGYNRFGLGGAANSLAYVDRLFWITNPSTGDTGLDTYIGANLRTRNPNGVPWNNGGTDQVIYAAAAKILWSFNSDSPTVAFRFPMQELPVGVRIVRATGQILLDDPACLVAAIAAGTEQNLLLGYPTTAINGLWYDLHVSVPWSRGPVVAVYPSVGFAGSASTDYGINSIRQIINDDFTSAYDLPAWTDIATQKAISVQDAVIEGDIVYYGLPTGFDVFTPGFALNMIMPATSPLDSRPMPVRTTVIRWPNEGPNIYTCTFRFSNRKAQFTGDDRYLHPAFTKDTTEGIIYQTGGGSFEMEWGSTSGMQGRPARRAEREAERKADKAVSDKPIKVDGPGAAPQTQGQTDPYKQTPENPEIQAARDKGMTKYNAGQNAIDKARGKGAENDTRKFSAVDEAREKGKADTASKKEAVDKARDEGKDKSDRKADAIDLAREKGREKGEGKSPGGVGGAP